MVIQEGSNYLKTRLFALFLLLAVFTVFNQTILADYDSVSDFKSLKAEIEATLMMKLNLISMEVILYLLSFLTIRVQ